MLKEDATLTLETVTGERRCTKADYLEISVRKFTNQSSGMEILTGTFNIKEDWDRLVSNSIYKMVTMLRIIQFMSSFRILKCNYS